MTRPPNVRAPDGWLEALAGHVPAGPARLSHQVTALAKRFDVHERTVWRWLTPRVDPNGRGGATIHMVPRRVKEDAERAMQNGALPRARQLEMAVQAAYLVADYALSAAREARISEATHAPAVVALLHQLHAVAAILEPHQPRAGAASRAKRKRTADLLREKAWTAGDGRSTTVETATFGEGAPRYHKIEGDHARAVPFAELLNADQLDDLVFSPRPRE
jgi:hypothetical protein